MPLVALSGMHNAKVHVARWEKKPAQFLLAQVWKYANLNHYNPQRAKK